MVIRNSGHPCALIWLQQAWNLLVTFIIFYLSFQGSAHVVSSAKSRWEREKSLLVLLFQTWICDGSLYRNTRYLIILRLRFRSIWRPWGIHGLMGHRFLNALRVDLAFVTVLTFVWMWSRTCGEQPAHWMATSIEADLGNEHGSSSLSFSAVHTSWLGCLDYFWNCKMCECPGFILFQTKQFQTKGSNIF